MKPIFVNSICLIVLLSGLSTAFGATNSGNNGIRELFAKFGGKSDQKAEELTIGMRELYSDLVAGLKDDENMDGKHANGLMEMAAANLAISNRTMVDLAKKLVPLLYIAANTYLPKNNILAHIVVGKELSTLSGRIWEMLDVIFQIYVPAELDELVRASSVELTKDEKQSLLCALNCSSPYKFGIPPHLNNSVNGMLFNSFSENKFCRDLNNAESCLEMCEFTSGSDAKYTTLVRNELKKIDNILCTRKHESNPLNMAKLSAGQCKFSPFLLTADQYVELFLKIAEGVTFIDRFMDSENGEKHCRLMKSTIVDDVISLLGNFCDELFMDVVEPILRIYSTIILSINTEGRMVKMCPKFYEV